MSNIDPARLRGAVDLSKLRGDSASTSPASASPGSGEAALGATGSSGVGQVIQMPLVALASAENLRDYLELSQLLPVLVDFFVESEPSSQAMSKKLEKLIAAAGGRLVLLRVDALNSREIASAFGVTAAPTLMAILRGQPAPLVSGDQPAEALAQVIDRVLQVAAENGLTARVDPADEGNSQSQAPQEPELPPRHKAAFDYISEGDFQKAADEYQAALRENPSDQMAKAGLAQASLLIRTKDKDSSQILSQQATNFESAAARADAHMLMGASSAAFEELLSWLLANPADREQVRTRLIELFEITGLDDPDVTVARAKLARLLF